MAAQTKSILEAFPLYEATIGIEIHVQLTTKSKIFCSCPNAITKEPNSHICQVCTGQPGTLPVLNRKVVDFAILAGMATRCNINSQCTFARKHYFYPDLPKNYQITQSNVPICVNGSVPIRQEDGTIKNIRLIRIHMEEDAGKSMHAAQSNESFVDFNRTGTPLLEIVSHPDISSASEAKAYLKAIRTTVQYLGICTGNMEDGAFRADTNISVRKKGAEKLGTKVELKNINSFKFIGDAIEYEIERQINDIEQGKKIKQETRLWNTKEGVTIPMRSKEEAADYRYCDDPDLPMLIIDDAWLARIKATLPELPFEKFDRLCAAGLTPYEAEIIVEDKALADYYEAAVKTAPAKPVVNWILRNLLGYLNDQKITLAECKVTPEKLSSLVNLVEQDVINNRVAQDVFVLVAQTGADPLAIVKEKGLEQIGSSAELEKIIADIIAQNPTEVAAFKAGKDKLMGFFVGQAMKNSGGKANPKIIQDLLKKALS